MTALREVRRAANLTQQEFAVLLDVPLNTFRMWDSGLRATPPHLVERATMAVTEHARNSELISLDQLARELGVHERTLRAAARIGRLQVQFSIRSAFGRPIRFATRAAGQAFIRTHYRDYGRKGRDVPPLPTVPADYDTRLKHLRYTLGLTQGAFAHRIGAANKAVVYQWESRQRRPSPVFWQRVQALSGTRAWRTPRPDCVEAAGAPFESSPDRGI
jgi:DNA-binding transcriptional regulator YiaG